MHLTPLPGSKWKGDGKGDRGTKRDFEGKPRAPHKPPKGASKGKCPEALSDAKLKHNCSKTKKRLCWNYNLSGLQVRQTWRELQAWLACVHVLRAASLPARVPDIQSPRVTGALRP